MFWLLQVELQWRLGCTCLLNDHFLRISSQNWGCLILGLAPLRGFFVVVALVLFCFWHAEAVLSSGCCQVHFHWACSGVTSPAGSLLHLLFVDLWECPVWLVGFEFSLFWLVFLQQLGMLCIYSCSGGLHFFFFSCFLYIKGCGEILQWQSASWNFYVFAIYFCNPYPGRFPEGSCH